MVKYRSGPSRGDVWKARGRLPWLEYPVRSVGKWVLGLSLRCKFPGGKKKWTEKSGFR